MKFCADEALDFAGLVLGGLETVVQFRIRFEEVLADRSAAWGDGGDAEVGSLAQPLQELQFESGDMECMGGSVAGGVEELPEDFEEAGEGGVGFSHAFDEPGGVGSLCEGCVALAKLGESFLERDFLQGVQSSLSAWGEGD